MVFAMGGQVAPRHHCRSGVHDCIFSTALRFRDSHRRLPPGRSAPVRHTGMTPTFHCGNRVRPVRRTTPPGRQAGQPFAYHRGHPLVMEDIRGIAPGIQCVRRVFYAALCIIAVPKNTRPPGRRMPGGLPWAPVAPPTTPCRAYPFFT